MEIQLYNELSGQNRTQKTGFATYILISWIPFGGIVTIFLSLVRKQFKIYFINLFLIFFVLSLFLILFTAFTIIFFSPTEKALTAIINFVFYLLYVGVIFLFAKDANRASIKWYLEHGYLPVGKLNEEQQFYVDEAKSKNYPWWALVR